MSTLTLAQGTRSGCAEMAGFGGEKAFFLENADLANASDYVRFPQINLGANSFTLRMWIKADRGACHGWCFGNEFLPVDDTTDPALYTDAQLAHASVLASNVPFGKNTSPMFAIMHLQPRAFLTVQFATRGGHKAVQFTGMCDTYDGRWHLITVSCDRDKSLKLYIDEKLRGEEDISEMYRQTAGDGPLTIGADANGQNGFGPGLISRFSFDDYAMGEDEIVASYYRDAIDLLLDEVAERGLTESALYDHAEAESFLKRAQAIAESDDEARIVYTRLRESYEAFLLRTREPDLKFMLTSDVHCDGDKGGRTLALRNGLKWANELGMQALMDGGDYSNFGKDFERDSFWHALDDLWMGKPVFSTLGNHETLELKCDELVRYQNDHLCEHGMLPAGYDKFYYEGEVNGYHFIVLGQYSDTYTVTGYKRMWRFAGEIKPEQIDFVNEKLEAYKEEGKPVFLVIHNALKPLIAQQVGDKWRDDMVIIQGDELYEAFKGHPEAVVCTGHVHHGFGGGAGLTQLEEGYSALDICGFRGGVIGYCIGERDKVGSCHGAHFVYVYGKTIVLRAVDLAKKEWLTAYDQTVTLSC